MKLENMFLKALEHEEHLIRYLVLDFTSVFAIDSSAAETIVSTVEICER
jgi:anti-anti-sigma regulatory factor